MPFVFLFALALLCSPPAAADSAAADSATTRPTTLVLSRNGATLRIDPATLAASHSTTGAAPRLVSKGLGDSKPALALVERLGPTEARIRHPETGLYLGIRFLETGIVFEFESDKPRALSWPVLPLAPVDHLVWPLADGRHVPVRDAAWMRDLAEEGDHDLGHGLPLWGWTDKQGTVAWATTTPYRQALAVRDGRLELKQTFLCREGKETHRLALRLADSVEPLLPAFLLRDELVAAGSFATMRDKFARLPAGSRERLLGAFHAYLWGEKAISVRDIKPKSFTILARRLSDDSGLGKRILGLMDAESRAAVAAFATNEWAGAYAKKELARGLDAALASIPPAELYARFGDCLEPPETWGEGMSPAMIRELAALGIDRARLTLPAAGSGRGYAATAIAARNSGYLFGIYDSYHSIHPKAIWGTDASWETARFTEELYETGAIMKADGGFLSGYQGKGRLLNPLAAWPFVQSRVEKNLAAAPLSFYFVDCDAAGEIHEDYNPRHPSSSEDGAEARRQRLKWLSEAKGLVVGSEGGDALIAPAILVSEGLFGPVFSWEEPEYRDKASPNYVGGYWPPEAPAVQFKAMKLKPDSVRRYFDPATRIPLFEAVFHDSLVITNHWSSDPWKYAGLENRAELFQLLYLAAPLYNLNRDRLAESGKRLKAHYDFYSPLHRRFGDAKLLGLDWLTSDRLVQRARFEGGFAMVVNFSGTSFTLDGEPLAAGSAAAFLPEGKILHYAPR